MPPPPPPCAPMHRSIECALGGWSIAISPLYLLCHKYVRFSHTLQHHSTSQSRAPPLYQLHSLKHKWIVNTWNGNNPIVYHIHAHTLDLHIVDSHCGQIFCTRNNRDYVHRSVFYSPFKVWPECRTYEFGFNEFYQSKLNDRIPQPHNCSIQRSFNKKDFNMETTEMEAVRIVRVCLSIHQYNWWAGCRFSPMIHTPSLNC